MKRTRVAGLVEMEGGYALMHRLDVKKEEGTNKPYGEYYVFPGGGVEPEDASFEDGVRREILEEFGITVEVIKQLYYRKINEEKDEYLYCCKYVDGVLGTGTGPEFSNAPEYANRGKYIPEIVPKSKIKEIRLLPEEFKDKLVKEIELK